MTDGEEKMAEGGEGGNHSPTHLQDESLFLFTWFPRRTPNLIPIPRQLQVRLTSTNEHAESQATKKAG